MIRSVPAHVVETCLAAMSRGRVLDMTDCRATAASAASLRHRLALADATNHSMAREHGAALLTQDVDCQGLPGVQYNAKPMA